MQFNRLTTSFATVFVSIFYTCTNLSMASTFANDSALGLSELEISGLPRSSDGRYAVFGDILIPLDVSAKAERPNRWTNGILYYEFDQSVSAAERQIFIDACSDWSAGTPVRCQGRASERNYVLVHTHSGGTECGGFLTSCSALGMLGGKQDLWMYVEQWAGGVTVRHELGHAFGKIHEQNRSDRDNFVDIHVDRALPGSWPQFSIDPSAQLFSEYDYDSIMHYPNCAYSTNASCTEATSSLQTIVSRHCTRDRVGGSAITTLDRDGLRNAYASDLQSVLVRERALACGEVTLHPDELPAFQSFAPLANVMPGWTKVDPPKYSSTCGMAPVGFGTSCRPPKKYITHWTDTDSSLNPSCLSKYEVWVVCGCPTATIRSFCTRIDKFKIQYDDLTSSQKAYNGESDWRVTRVLYFQKVLNELDRDGLVSQDVLEFVPTFYQVNYLDSRFETKMLKVRGGVFAFY
jgi:hypothetical protein